VRKDALGLLPRCNGLSDLLREDNQKRYAALGRQVWARNERITLGGLLGVVEHQNMHPVGLGQDTAYEHTIGSPQRSDRYVHTPTGTPLAVSNGDGVYDFLHQDGQNNTVLALNPGNTIACGPELDPWGEANTDCDDYLTPDTANRKWYNSARLDTT